MVILFNVDGESRKAMVKAIENELGVKTTYLGVPSCVYQIGDYKVGKAVRTVSDYPMGFHLSRSYGVLSRKPQTPLEDAGLAERKPLREWSILREVLE